MKFYNYISALAATALLFTACETKDDDSPEPPSSEKAELAFHFDHNFGSEAFELNKDYQLSSGNTVNLSFVKFHISGIVLMDDAGTPTPVDQYLLIDQSSHHIEVADIDPQHVHVVRFNIGVDSAANHSDPTTYPDGHPLSPQNPAMHWSWASGYIFFKVEGMVDTTSDGIMDANFEYHIGLDQFLREVSGMQHKDVEAGEEFIVDVAINYEKFFEGINMNFELSAHGMDDPHLSKRIADNATGAFSIE